MCTRQRLQRVVCLLFLFLGVTLGSRFRWKEQNSLSRGRDVLPRRGGRSIIKPVIGRKREVETVDNTKESNQVVQGNGTASIPNEIFNLVKSIVGAGVLGLPAGIAAYGSAPSAAIPAVALICGIGFMSAHGFMTIGRVCSLTSSNSYKEAWARSVGPGSSWMPATACLLVTSCSVLAYSMILSETLPQLLARVSIQLSRTQALFGTTLTVLLPLCLLKELSSLAPFSLVGISGMIYTTIAMAIRYFRRDYVVDGNGAFSETNLESVLRPEFGDMGALSALSADVFVLVSMLSTAYMAHYNAPKFYNELYNNTQRRFNTVVLTSFAVSILMFASVASLGFLTFGKSCTGVILNNYSTTDGLMSLSRFAVALSLISSYPLAFVGVRDGVLDLAKVQRENRSPALLNTVTLLLLGVITGLAYVMTDIRALLAFGGATWGNAVIYLFPNVMIWYCSQKFPDSSKRLQKPISLCVGILGLIMGVIGTSRAIHMV